MLFVCFLFKKIENGLNSDNLSSEIRESCEIMNLFLSKFAVKFQKLVPNLCEKLENLFNPNRNKELIQHEIRSTAR